MFISFFLLFTGPGRPPSIHARPQNGTWCCPDWSSHSTCRNAAPGTLCTRSRADTFQSLETASAPRNGQGPEGCPVCVCVFFWCQEIVVSTDIKQALPFFLFIFFFSFWWQDTAKRNHGQIRNWIAQVANVHVHSRRRLVSLGVVDQQYLQLVVELHEAVLALVVQGPLDGLREERV